MTPSRMRLIQRGVAAPNRAHPNPQSHPWRRPWNSEGSKAAYQARPGQPVPSVPACGECESDPCRCPR